MGWVSTEDILEAVSWTVMSSELCLARQRVNVMELAAGLDKS